MRLPEPMLARPGPLPTGRGWAFEPKWHGFRAIIRSGDDYTVRSRRGWQMTELLSEFASLPVEGVFDGELVAFGSDGLPSHERLTHRILGRDMSVPVAFIVFDVLEVEGLSTMHQPYRERRRTVELLSLGPGCHLTPSFEDGEALWESVWEPGLEGVVAKRLNERYRPGERAWVKLKNRGWSRYEAEREAVARQRSRAR